MRGSAAPLSGSVTRWCSGWRLHWWDTFSFYRRLMEASLVGSALIISSLDGGFHGGSRSHYIVA